MIDTRWPVMLLVLMVPLAQATECTDAPKKELLYLALDTAIEHRNWNASESAIQDYHRVITSARSRHDKSAVQLSCTMLTRMLLKAEQFAERSELYSDCSDDLVQRALDSRMPPAEPGADAVHSDYLPIVRVAPVYPKKALKKGVTGLVILEFTIESSGRVRSDRVTASSNRVFEKAAREALRKFRYKPRVINGKPVATPGVVTQITFKLSDKNETYTREQDCA